MKKGPKRFLLVIFILFLIYQVDDYFWQRNREKEIEQVIVAMQNSLDELESFLQKNEDDLEYLVTKCVEDDISIYYDSVHSLKGPGNPRKINAEQEVLSRRDRLIANLPSDIKFYYINSVGIKLNNNSAIFETLHIKISSPPFTKDADGYSAGSIDTIKLNRTWTINVGSHDYWDYLRARKILERMENEQNKN